MLEPRVVRVVLVDDHAPLRRLMRDLLEERGCEVVAEAGDGLAALEALAAVGCDCDVVVMDFSMPQLDGVDATQVIVRRHPGVEVVAFTTYDDPLMAAAMLEAGATCHFVKPDFRALVDHVTSRQPRDGVAAA